MVFWLDAGALLVTFGIKFDRFWFVFARLAKASRGHTSTRIDKLDRRGREALGITMYTEHALEGPRCNSHLMFCQVVKRTSGGTGRNTTEIVSYPMSKICTAGHWCIAYNNHLRQSRRPHDADQNQDNRSYLQSSRTTNAPSYIMCNFGTQNPDGILKKDSLHNRPDS